MPPPPPLKLRLLLFLPVLPALIALLLLAMLVVDRPILFFDRALRKVYYEGGEITYASITPDVWVGPSTETVNGPYGLVYKYFGEEMEWEHSLPRRNLAHLGITYSSAPRAEAKGSSFVAARWQMLRIHTEYFIALAAVGLIWTIVFYRRAQRAYRNLCRGYCPACGYDLRATPDRCPECGHVDELVRQS